LEFIVEWNLLKDNSWCKLSHWVDEGSYKKNKLKTGKNKKERSKRIKNKKSLIKWDKKRIFKLKAIKELKNKNPYTKPKTEQEMKLGSKERGQKN